MRDVFSRDLERIELPPPASWLPGARSPKRSVWSGLVAVPALAGVVVLALVVAFVIQLARGELPAQVASSPSPSASATAPITATGGPPAPSPLASASATPSTPRLPASNAVEMQHTLPASGQWTLIVRRGYTYTPNNGAPGRVLPSTDTISAVPLAPTTKVGQEIPLLSFTSAVVRNMPTADNLIREQLSPDGHRLVLSVILDEGRHPAGSVSPQARLALVLVDLVVGTVGALTTDAAYSDLQPAWSPDGSFIAFVRQGASQSDPPNEGIWVVRPDGTGLRRVLAGDAHSLNRDILYSWNGDGSAIGFARGSEASNLQLVDLTTGRVAQVGDRIALNRPMGDWRTSSPAFVGAFARSGLGDDGPFYIDTADQQGQNARDVITSTVGTSFLGQARWRPGSNDFLYRATTVDQARGRMTVTLQVSDASGRAPRQIVARESPFNAVVGAVAFFAAWTPDGRDVVYLWGQNVVGELHLVAPDGSNDRLIQGFGGAPEAEIDWIDLAVLFL